MRCLLPSLALTASFCSLTTASVLPRQDTEYAGYLLSTFTDENPSVFWYLSSASDPLAFQPLNGGDPISDSTIGTGGVRDIFLTSNEDHTEFFVIATDLDINADGFSWDEATRRGSLALTIWKSTDLLEWSEPWLATYTSLVPSSELPETDIFSVESPQGGMAWAPSAIYNPSTATYDLFWASRLYDESDSGHTGNATLDRIRHATTTDFVTFSSPEDYVALDAENIPLIDQEFLYLGEEGHYARFLKDENVLHVYQETTTEGLFGSWSRSPSPDDSGYIVTRTFEGPAAFPDIQSPGKYYLLMDDYTEYIPFVTEDVASGIYEELAIEGSGLPRGLKHGNVFLVTGSEYEGLVERYGL
ncbi:putative arabinosidase [Aspergillus unguis]